jgi:uncharacterized membrane protein
MLMPFAAPLRAQAAVVAAALDATLVESADAWSIAGINHLAPGSDNVNVAPSVVIVIYATDVLVSLPLTFVPMAALFDGERLGPAFTSSLRAFARNPQTMLALAAYTFVLVLAGIATTGIGLVLGLPWIAAAQYAAWKDIYGVAVADPLHAAAHDDVPRDVHLPLARRHANSAAIDFASVNPPQS